MVITAKFPSVCPCCSSRIVVGSKVEWSKGAKATHVACSGTGPRVVAAAPAPVATYRRRTAYTHCEGWGSDNPHAPRHGHCADCAAMG